MVTYILGGITNVPNNGDFFVKIPKYESQGDSGLKFVFSAIIMNSNVRVEVQTEKEVEDLGTLRNRVTNALRNECWAIVILFTKRSFKNYKHKYAM